MTTGEHVIGTARGTTYHGGYKSGSYYAYVDFTTKAGADHTVEIAVFREGSYPYGAPVPLLYATQDPSSAELDTLSSFWLGPTGLLLLSSLSFFRLYRLRQAAADE
jgi:hypothetical protein